MRSPGFSIGSTCSCFTKNSAATSTVCHASGLVSRCARCRSYDRLDAGCPHRTKKPLTPLQTGEKNRRHSVAKNKISWLLTATCRSTVKMHVGVHLPLENRGTRHNRSKHNPCPLPSARNADRC